jgi:hypothetical protein
MSWLFSGVWGEDPAPTRGDEAPEAPEASDSPEAPASVAQPAAPLAAPALRTAARVQLGLGVLHACLWVYVLATALARLGGLGSACLEQQLYTFDVTWADSTITATGSLPKGDVSVNSAALLLVAEGATALGHLLLWRGLLGRQATVWGCPEGGLHGIKIVYYLEYAVSASAMAVCIFNVYSGYLDYRLPGLIGTGVGVAMLTGAWLDVGRFVLRECRPCDQVRHVVTVLAAVTVAAVTCFVAALWAPALSELHAGDVSPPDFVFYIVYTQLVLFASFGVAQSWYTWVDLRGDAGGEPLAELTVFGLLSAVSKGLLLLLLSSGLWFTEGCAD